MPCPLRLLTLAPLLALGCSTVSDPGGWGPWQSLDDSDLTPAQDARSGSASAGGLSARGRPVQEVSLGLDADGRVVIAWVEGARGKPTLPFNVRTRTRTESGWSDTRAWDGGGRLALTRTGEPAWVAIDRDQAPGAVAASMVTDGDQASRAAPTIMERFSGPTPAPWRGGVAATAVDSAGRQLIARTTQDDVVVYRSAGDDWQILGDDPGPMLISGRGRRVPLVVLTDPADQPIVAWRRYVPPSERIAENTESRLAKSRRAGGLFTVMVKAWRDGAWVWLSAPDAPALHEDAPPAKDKVTRAERQAWARHLQRANIAATVDPAGQPVIAWPGIKQLRVRRWDGAQWIVLPGPEGGTHPENPSLTWHPTHGLLATWAARPVGAHPVDGTDIYAARFDGDRWIALGDGARVHRSTSESSFSDAVFDADGAPVVAWVEQIAGGTEVYLRRFDGTAWSEWSPVALGAGLSSASDAIARPRLTISPDGHPTAAWVTNRAGGNASVATRTHQQTGWQSIAPLNVGGAHRMLTAAGPDGTLFAAWERRAGAPGLYAARWDGSAWEAMPGDGDNNSLSEAQGRKDLAFAVDSQGRALIGGRVGARKHRVHRWQGGAWAALGDDPLPIRSEQHAVLTVDGQDRPTYTALGGSGRKRRLQVVRWMANTWADLGDPAKCGIDGSPILELDAASTAGNGMALAWRTEPAGADTLGVCTWDGTQWRALPSPIPDGVSLDFDGWEGDAAAIDVETLGDSVFVAFEGHRDAGRQIWTRRWDGAAWSNLSPEGDSATACPGSCGRPDLAIAGRHACLAWKQPGDGGAQLALRCSSASGDQ